MCRTAIKTLKDLFHDLLKQTDNDALGISDDPTRSDHLCDAISEAADMSVDLYNGPLYNFIGDKPEYAEEALSEFGYEGCGSSLLGVARMAEYLYHERKLYDNLTGLVSILLLRALFRYGIDPNADAEKYRGMIEDYAENVETCDRIVDITDEFIERIKELKAG